MLKTVKMFKCEVTNVELAVYIYVNETTDSERLVYFSVTD